MQYTCWPVYILSINFVNPLEPKWQCHFIVSFVCQIVQGICGLDNQFYTEVGLKKERKTCLFVCY